MNFKKNYIYKSLNKRLGKISITYAIIFTLINTIFLILLKDILIRLLLFFLCAIILYYVGRLPAVDLDPVPFITGIHFFLFGYISTLQFMVWTIPATDVISNRLNQWTLINFVSLFLGLSLIYFINFNQVVLMIILIVVHNLARALITLTIFKAKIYELNAPISNLVFYVILANLVFSYINL